MDNGMIIRKPRFIKKELFDDDDIDRSASKHTVPKNIIQKYNEIRNNIGCKTKQDGLERKVSYFNLQPTTSFYDLNSDRTPRKAQQDEDELIYEDQVSNIEIVGIGKLKSEVQCVKRIQGDKIFVKNHYYNELGEGEPNFEEEIIA